MIDLEDCKRVTLKSGRSIPRYRATCSVCGSDRGYMDKNAGLRHNSCRKCANKIIANNVHKGKVISNETKIKMSNSAIARYNDPEWIPKKDVVKTGRVYIVYNTEEQRKIKHNVRSLLWQKLKRRNLTKNKKTFKLLDYTPDDLIKHLEKQFKEGMSWDSYGEWHIDHIVPDSWFNYSSTEDEDFKKSWALSNLQPLWAEDNLSKNNKYRG